MAGGSFSSAERPAPGYRERVNGALVYVGSHGFSYSSSVSGSDGVYLRFSVAHLYPSTASCRAYGLQLRCLSEETVPSGTPK